MDMDMGTQVPGRQQAQEGDDLEAVTLAWCCKRLSNLDYLLHLNRLAGRRYGDPTFHPFLPWSAPPPPPQLTLLSTYFCAHHHTGFLTA